MSSHDRIVETAAEQRLTRRWCSRDWYRLALRRLARPALSFLPQQRWTALWRAPSRVLDDFALPPSITATQELVSRVDPIAFAMSVPSVHDLPCHFRSIAIASKRSLTMVIRVMAGSLRGNDDHQG